MHKPQVNKSHYNFTSYFTKQRWASLWHQLHEVLELHPASVLEIGPGIGFFKLVASLFDLKVETVDVAHDLNPDHIASATRLPFADDTYDCVCAFQMLEHLPYEESLQAFREMLRVSKKNIVISLPDVRPQWRYCIHIPKWGQIDKLVNKPLWRPQEHRFTGEHYWEINKIGYTVSKVTADFATHGGTLLRTFRVAEFPSHRYFVFRKVVAEKSDASGAEHRARN